MIDKKSFQPSRATFHKESLTMIGVLAEGVDDPRLQKVTPILKATEIPRRNYLKYSCAIQSQHARAKTPTRLPSLKTFSRFKPTARVVVDETLREMDESPLWSRKAHLPEHLRAHNLVEQNIPALEVVLGFHHVQSAIACLNHDRLRAPAHLPNKADGGRIFNFVHFVPKSSPDAAQTPTRERTSGLRNKFPATFASDLGFGGEVSGVSLIAAASRGDRKTYRP